MTKHTQYPWFYAYGSVYADKNGNGDTGPDNPHIALADRGDRRTTPGERDANMRLCASTPAMLSLLRSLKIRIEDWNLDDTVRDINNVIEHATGESVPDAETDDSSNIAHLEELACGYVPEEEND